MAVDSVRERELIERHEAARRRLRILRIVSPVVIGGIVLLNLWGMANQVQAFDADALPEHLREEAQHLWPDLRPRVEHLGAELESALVAEMERQWAQAQPQLEKRLDAEVAVLKAHAEETLERQVQAALEHAEARQRAILAKYLPEIANDPAAQQRVLEAVRVAIVKWASKKFAEAFDDHIEAIAEIRKTLDTHYRKPGGGGPDEAEQAIGAWLELVAESIGDVSSTFDDEPSRAHRRRTH